MILSDREIQAAIRDKNILIDPPPDEALFSSTALDLTLDGVLLRWKEPGDHPSGQPIKLCPSREGFDIRAMMTDPHYSAKVSIDPKEGFDLEPHKFVLGYTQEKIYLPNQSRIAARVEGKSSLARLGVGVHVTAPTIHAGSAITPKTRTIPDCRFNWKVEVASGEWRENSGEPVGCVELAITRRSASRCVFTTHPTCCPSVWCVFTTIQSLILAAGKEPTWGVERGIRSPERAGSSRIIVELAGQ